jgi:hypothetical protein
MFKIKFLRNILLTSTAIVIMFPLYDIFIAYPSFIKLLSEEAKDVSVRTATYLTAILNLRKRGLNKEYLAFNSRSIESIMRDLNILKIKIYSSSGEAVYSTDQSDVEHIINEKYINIIMDRGDVFTRLRPEGAESVEGHPVETSLAVTYVPIMKSSSFSGIIKIYYDITKAKGRYDKIRSEAVVLAIILASGLMILVFITSFKASKVINERAQISGEREELILELREALAKVKTLRGLLPICSVCNKIRNDRGDWISVDVYITEHSEADFTHGYCPQCEKKQFPRNFKKVN